MRLKTVTDKILTVCVLVTQSCLTLCNPMDCRPPGASVQWIFQERVLEWVAIPFSRGSCQPRYQTWSAALQADSLPSEPPGKSCQFSDIIKIQLLLRRKLRYTDLSHPRPLFGSPWSSLHPPILSGMSCMQRLLPWGRVSGALLVACVGGSLGRVKGCEYGSRRKYVVGNGKRKNK